MTITRGLMANGSFGLSWVADAPQELLDDIKLHDYVVVLPNWLASAETLSVAEVLAIAKDDGFTGIITSVPSVDGLSGAHLSWLLGDSRDVGPIVEDDITLVNGTLNQWIDELLPRNGLTKGTVTNTGFTVSRTIPKYTPLRTALGRVCSWFDTEWRVNDDATVDVAVSTVLWPTAPTLIVRRDMRVGEAGLEALDTNVFDISIDGSQMAGRVIAVGDNGVEVDLTATPTLSRWKALDGSPLDRTRVLDMADEPAAVLTAVATRSLNIAATPDVSIEMSSIDYRATAKVNAGARVWAYDRRRRVFDLSNPLQLTDSMLYPMRLRAASVTSGITDGSMVLVINAASQKIRDVTAWVVKESPDVSWEVSVTGRRRANAVSGSIVMPLAAPETQLGTAPTSGPAGSSGRSASLRRSPKARPGAVWTLTNVNVGASANSLNTGHWAEIARGFMWVFFFIRLGTPASGAAVTGDPLITMPAGWQIDDLLPAGGDIFPSGGRIRAGGTNTFDAVVGRENDTQLVVYVRRSDVDDSRFRSISATVPGTWGDGDFIRCHAIVPVRRT